MTSPGVVAPPRVDAVVVGASAGGVEALLSILPTVPAGCPFPIMIVLHLPRERPSLLVDIFKHKCALSVQEPSDKDPILPGTIYFAPPDYHLLVSHRRRFVLSVDEDVHFSRPSIDVLFESAVEVYRSRLLGIVMTGASHDGAAGLKAIGLAGGMTIVQTPESAVSAVMPEAAIKAAAVDRILTLEEIGSLLRELGGAVASTPR